jgi:signal transduction histidine kinase
MPSLFVIQGRDQGKRFELDAPCVGIGRDTTNLVQLHDTEVSRQHAELQWDSGRYQLVDLGSSNGSYVNGHSATRHDLSSGDRIQVGRTLMIYTASERPLPNDDSKVTIVGQGSSIRASRIVKAIGPEESSGLFGDPALSASNSPWLARARSNLQIMYRTALAVSHTMDIDQLLLRIMDLIFEWVEADRGCVLLVDRESDELEVKVRRDRQGGASRALSDESLAISRTILDYVRDNQEGVMTSDAREDERFDAAGSIIKLGVHEAICVPMQGRYGVVGIIYIDTFTPPGRVVQETSRNKFNEDHLKLMIAIGHQAALAIEDTCYYSAMVQAERLAAIGQTIASLSHHIKNILQGIRGGSYLIEEGLKAEDPEVTRKGWRIVERNQERISSLVMDMLTFSKSRQPEMVTSDLNEIVGEVLDLMRSRAGDAGVELVDKRAADLPPMTFDGEGLHRAILNIVTNAIDACAENQGSVEVATEHDSEQRRLRVIVRDTGVGIPREDLPRIFSPFESRKGSRGTGLGLAVSQKILQEHSGDIRVESQFGKGSCFVLEWPAVPPRDDHDFAGDTGGTARIE